MSECKHYDEEKGYSYCSAWHIDNGVVESYKCGKCDAIISACLHNPRQINRDYRKKLEAKLNDIRELCIGVMSVDVDEILEILGEEEENE